MTCGGTWAGRTRNRWPEFNDRLPGKPDAAYGAYAFRIRVATAGVDILIGHVRTVDVRPGQAVARGQRIALSGDEGAPDGCHLHVEVRSAAGGLATARDPLPLLGLHPVG